MKFHGSWRAGAGALAALITCVSTSADALVVSRLTPPSELFATGNLTPIISRFVVGQRFDLQATVQPDAGQTITSVEFLVDGAPVVGTVSLTPATAAGLPANTTVATLRAFSSLAPGVHTLSASALQSNLATTTANGNFEIVGISNTGRKAKNIIIMFGDGMGSGHRTAARIMLEGIAQGKPKGKLAMDTFPTTAMIMTASLNSIVTDSAPGMQNYVTGNKSANNQEGVWPDDTTAAFDNPRIEYLSEYLARTQGKKLGIVATSDVFDATPASNAIHTANRGNGTGIVDQYFDDRSDTNLTVLMGGGRKWFIPNPTACPDPDCGTATGFNGSARGNTTDYVLPAELSTGWGVATGALDPGRDLISDFSGAGWSYAATASDMASAPLNQPLLGLFSLSNMNVALDKIDGRRGATTLVNDYGFPDQPMLDEMTQKAIDVLDAQSPTGFVLMVEAASIDKQAHNMDTERFILDTIEFDRAVGVAKAYAVSHPDTIVIVAADHECGGVAVIGGSLVTDASLATRATSGLGAAQLRTGVVGTYEAAGFPAYAISPDGYPTSTNVDRRMLIGYGANADRFEDWRTNPQPLRDSQQPGNGVAPLNGYPSGPLSRDVAGNFQVTGQIADGVAAHTANDVPLSSYGRGSSLIGGTMDNTDVFFALMQAAIGGAK